MNRFLYGFVVIATMILATPVYAHEFYGGLHGGLNLADLRITITDPTVTDYESKSRTLFGVGGFFGVSLNEYLSVQFEPTYVAKGAVLTGANSTEMKIRSSQLDLGLVAKAGLGEAVRPFILGGPFMSLLFNATLEAESAGRVWEGDMQEVLKRTELGVVFGTGVNVAILNGSAFLEGRYALGLTNLNKGGGFDLRSGDLVQGRFTTDPKDEIETRCILVMIGYQLPVGGE